MFTNEPTTQNQELRLLSLKDVLARTALSKSTIYQLIKDGAFPKQIAISVRRVGWLESEIDNWIQSKI